MSFAVYSVTSFRKSIENILSKKKAGYQSCPEDICNLLSSYSFDALWETRMSLLADKNRKLLKLRVQNSFLRLSKADGYRLILCCDKTNQSVVLLNIYPKRGTLQKINQSVEETKYQLVEYIKERNSNSLVQHDIDNKLAVI